MAISPSITWISPFQSTATVAVTSGGSNTIPAGSTVSVSLTSPPASVTSFSVSIKSDDGKLNGFNSTSGAGGVISFVLPKAGCTITLFVTASDYDPIVSNIKVLTWQLPTSSGY